MDLCLNLNLNLNVSNVPLDADHLFLLHPHIFRRPHPHIIFRRLVRLRLRVLDPLRLRLRLLENLLPPPIEGLVGQASTMVPISKVALYAR